MCFLTQSRDPFGRLGGGRWDCGAPAAPGWNPPARRRLHRWPDGPHHAYRAGRPGTHPRPARGAAGPVRVLAGPGHTDGPDTALAHPGIPVQAELSPRRSPSGVPSACLGTVPRVGPYSASPDPTTPHSASPDPTTPPKTGPIRGDDGSRRPRHWLTCSLGRWADDRGVSGG